MIDVWKRGNNGNDLNYQRGGFSSLQGGPPSGTVNICPNMAARVNTGGGVGPLIRRCHMSPCVFHKMRPFNDGFIISPSGEKNSERELRMTWTEGERALGWKSGVPAGRLEENKNRSSERWNLCFEGAYSWCCVGHRRLNGLCHMWYGPADTKGLLRLWPCGGFNLGPFLRVRTQLMIISLCFS